jgi:hypothetical protein
MTMSVCFIEDAFAGQKKDVARSTWMGTLFRSFGKRWYEKVLPLQKDTTVLAWPGVNWDSGITFA